MLDAGDGADGERGDLGPRLIAVPAGVFEAAGLPLAPQAERIFGFLVARRDAEAIVGGKVRNRCQGTRLWSNSDRCIGS